MPGWALVQKDAPQWSPPLAAGALVRVQRPVGLLALAAMEPAAERREHQPTQHRVQHGLLAAMEPAAEQRETPNCAWVANVAQMPQWSPPLNGGSTGRCDVPAGDVGTPQWSPPLNGGSMALRIRAV